MMSAKLTSQEFLLFQRYFKEDCGIDFPENKAYLIENRLERLLKEYKINHFIDLYYRLCSSPKNTELAHKVTDAITIKETYWFRDKSPWGILEEVLIPAFANELAGRSRSKVRIWSAACSTGQEPYSLAMAIDNYAATHGRQQIGLADFDILATDLSNDALQRAKAGRYDSVSVERGLSSHYRNRYLRQEGQTWAVTEKIKNAVTFQQFNLKSSFLLLGKFDVIFCRNVAIYFHEEFRKLLFHKLAQALMPGGILFLGNSELFPDYKDYFVQETCNKAVYYRSKL